jgi:hypothetical protein
MTKAVSAIYFLLLLSAAACGVIHGGGVSKCPADATCGWVDIAGEKFWLCASPSQLQALKLKAARLEVRP